MEKEQCNWRDYWLCEGIIVTVMRKGLAGNGYYKLKGLVIKVIDKYVVEFEKFDSKHVPGVDQEELETVIPQIGDVVRIVNGAYWGSNARLLSIDTGNYCANKVKVERGIFDGRVLQALDYEDICKITNELPESAVAIISSNQGIVGNLVQVSSADFLGRHPFPLKYSLSYFQHSQ